MAKILTDEDLAAVAVAIKSGGSIYTTLYRHSAEGLLTTIARLQEQLTVAQRLLNFTPDQLELLVDPEKLAYVTWNMACTHTLQLMCQTYREGKMEVRRLQERVEELEKHDCGWALMTAIKVGQKAKALAERRKKALEAQEDWENHWPSCDDCYAAENLGGSETERRDRCERGALLLGEAASQRRAAIEEKAPTN